MKEREVRSVSSRVADKVWQHGFLFGELVKRDFKKKYKRTVLGMGWSMLMPLLTLAVMYLVFSKMWGRNVNHFTTYLFCGNIVFGWFSDATKQGMRSLFEGAGIFSKVNVPKYLFPSARSVQTLLNFFLTLVVFFLFCWMDGISFTWKMLFLLYPIVTLLVFNLGMGLTLSSFYVFFRDLDYIWGVFVQLLMYGSAIFYPVDRLPTGMQQVLSWNPVYRHIAYFREITIESVIPSVEEHLALAGFALVALIVGFVMYRRNDTEFLYYV